MRRAKNHLLRKDHNQDVAHQATTEEKESHPEITQIRPIAFQCCMPRGSGKYFEPSLFVRSGHSRSTQRPSHVRRRRLRPTDVGCSWVGDSSPAY